jgi:hypothetical protein
MAMPEVHQLVVLLNRMLRIVEDALCQPKMSTKPTNLGAAMSGGRFSGSARG